MSQVRLQIPSISQKDHIRAEAVNLLSEPQGCLPPVEAPGGKLNLTDLQREAGGELASIKSFRFKSGDEESHLMLLCQAGANLKHIGARPSVRRVVDNQVYKSNLSHFPLWSTWPKVLKRASNSPTDDYQKHKEIAKGPLNRGGCQALQKESCPTEGGASYPPLIVK